MLGAHLPPDAKHVGGHAGSAPPALWPKMVPNTVALCCSDHGVVFPV